MSNKQNFDHISSQKNWTFTQNDMIAEKILSKVQENARMEMPSSIYSPFVMTHYEKMKQHKLYSMLKTIPKGVLHHCHFDCCEDKGYDLSEFRLGNKTQAEQQKWVSMAKLRSKFKEEDEMLDFLSNLTMLSPEDNRKIAAKQIVFWPLFEKKISNFFPILFSLHQFKNYIKYISQKFIKNGYDRLQWRSMICELTEYDHQGNILKKHPQRKYMETLDEIQAQIKQQYPNFSFGVIFFGLKMFTPAQNQEIFTNVCNLNWNKTLGFDLVQQQDAYGPLQQYDEVISRVLSKYPHLNYKKVYHAGETKNPLNNNIEVAVKAGSVRIGHGINILQRMEFLPHCKNVSFEINHISNILSGLRDDTRISSAPILMSLGYALTINPDDPGKFGYEDSTVDYFSAFISFNWSLKQLKLLGVHSINHSICSEEDKTKLLQSFNQRWDSWVNQIIKNE